MHACFSRSRAGFTLIELLTVIAIIGILAAIIIPTTGAVRTAARKSQVRSMFSSWGNAFQLFKTEYGYFPDVTAGSNRLDGTTAGTQTLVRTLTGKNVDGSNVVTFSDLNGNKRRMSFLTFSDSELPTSTNIIADSFGNTQIGILVDRNGDGMIKNGGSDDGAVPGVVAAANGSTTFSPTTGSTTSDIPSAGVRAGAIFYTAGKDGSTSDAVMSWK